MKRGFYLGFLICLLSGIEVHAQEGTYWNEQRFRGGIIAGGNFSQVDGDRDAGVHKVGLNGGLSSYVALSPKLDINLELLYAQKGSRYAREWSSTAGPYLMVYQMKLDYIEIPLLLHYEALPNVLFGAGISYNRLIRSEERYRSLYGWVSFDPEKFPFKKDEWEYVLSAGYRLGKRMLVNLRYQYSLTPIRTAENVPEDFSGYQRQRNNLFALRLAYYL
ncbi:hypothetical protein DBR32_07170 [Taibaiella sp. KBW10]|uniref:porin family protein n=1 Tax=Taibaiella sp. KBW10 TaxID=2153357 RepID=UPI000F5A1D98|nr:porin family protein [Taibaiella sp. KBW10]RQO31719.1 hypothetical protein DBR32_07170 [Taibaiella sp. KBW10]